MKLKQKDLDFTQVVEAARVRKPSLGARSLSVISALFFICMLIWASLASVDEVTKAEGKVISSKRIQSIQNLEGGIIREILVYEGQIVEKDTVLARLDNAMAQSNYRDAVVKTLETQGTISRLQAELQKKEPNFSDELITNAPELVETQKALYYANQAQKKSELSLLESQYTQRVNELAVLKEQKNTLNKSHKLAAEQRDIAYKLMMSNNYSRVEYLGMEQQVVGLQGEIKSITATIPKAEAAIEEASERIRFREAEYTVALNEELSKKQAELASYKEAQLYGSDKVTRTELYSPVKGTVNKIYLSTVGGVVKPGESIIDIVPFEDNLLIEARIRPQDVAFLYPNQEATIRFTAYDFSIFGGLKATLENISADTIEDNKGESFYLIKLRTKENAIEYKGKDLAIIPGMMVQADILTGKKTVLEYILKPLLKAKQNALIER